MPISSSKTEQQVNFGGALNAVVAPHALAPDEVQAATNVDFGIELGAITARRGSLLFSGNTTSSPANLITRNYGLSTGTWVDTSIPWYVAAGNGFIYSGSGTAPTLATIGSGGGSAPQLVPGYSQYGSYIYIANGTAAYRTNGTNTFNWLIPQADTPTVVIAQQGTSTTSSSLAPNGGPFVPFQTVFTAVEGTVTASSTSTAFGTLALETVILSTCTSGTGSRIVITSTCTVTNWENPVVFVTTPTGTSVTLSTTGTFTLGGGIDFHQGYPNGDTTGTYTAGATVTQTLTIGPYGVDYMLLGLANQQNVVSIQRDLSIGDATFTNYWHAETTAGAIVSAASDPLSGFLTQQTGFQTLDVQNNAINNSRLFLPRLTPTVAQTGPQPLPNSRSIGFTATAGISAVSGWAVPRTSYQFVGTIPNPDFRNIQAIRIIVEFNTTGQRLVTGGLATYGGEGWLLTDQVGGISYFQTYARVENGFIVNEGAPSPPSPPQLVQFGNARLNAATTPSDPQITHRVFYRTGGLLSDAYRVGSCTITSGTATIYDYNLPDLTIINNPIMTRNLWSTWPDPSAGTGLPGVNVVSLPWQYRIFIGVGNQLYWTAPGRPSSIQTDVQTQVSDSGDSIAAIHPGQNLTIVNQASVFEMSGTQFEGVGANWTLQRTGARRGSAAPKTCINTPYGILLFGYDGLSFYRQGFGLDQELPWVYEKIGDLWKGNGVNDPAFIKGRIPALNPLMIFNACAAYKDDRVYLAVPTGSSTYANNMFVLDMARQKVWMYNYPWNITSLFWDRVANRLMAGTEAGSIQQLEVGLSDQQTNGTPVNTNWSVSTREWSMATDQLMENLQVENVGTITWLADADNTNTYTLGTTSAPSKAWSPSSLRGTVADNLNFIFQGTQFGAQQSIYALEWDAIPEAKKVTFYQTDPVAIPSENYVKTWLADLNVYTGSTNTATVTGSVLVDGTVVQTATFVSTPSNPDLARRKVYETGLPNVTYGKNVYAVYNSTTPFRYYSTDWELEAKPFSKLTWLVTYKKAGGVTQADMGRFFAMDIEGQATNTLTSTWIIDGTAFSTNTLTFGATDTGEEAGRVRNYMDWISFPPGGRGYLFQQQVTSTIPFKVWRSSLDIDRIGIKGLSRITLNGTPA